MSIKWWVFFLSTWAMLIVFGMIAEESFARIGTGGDYRSVMDTLMSMKIVSDVTIAGHTVGWLPDLTWFGALRDALTFRFSYMKDSFIGGLGYFTVFIPISVAMIIASLFSLLRGAASSS